MTASQSPVLSVVIVNYNGRRFMRDCLNSLECELSIPYEVVVVDNASPDNDASYIGEHFPEVLLIAADKNLGFAGGNNLGVAKAQGEFIVLLNNDTMLCSDLVSGIELLERDETVGVVGAKMLDVDSNYRHSVQRFPNFPACLMVRMLNYRTRPFKHGNFPEESLKNGYSVDMVEGSFMLLRKSLWEQLKGMDASIFMYGEDTDFCKQVQLAGKRIVFLPSLQYVHFGGFNPEREYLIVDGILRYHRRYSSRSLYYLVYGSMLVRSVARFLLFSVLSMLKSRKINQQKSLGAFLSLRRNFL